MSAEKIKAALEKLDFQADAQWTEDGLPRIDVLKTATGLFGLTREQVNMAWPGFSRAALQGAGQASASTAPAPVSAPASAPADPAATQGAADAPNAPAVLPAVITPSENGDEVSQAEPQSEAERIREELAAAKERFARARDAKKEADQEFEQATQALDHWIAQSEEVLGEEPLAETLKGYFASQARERERRIAQQQRLAGVNLRDLLPSRAPIDQALARRNTRGTQRPGS